MPTNTSGFALRTHNQSPKLLTVINQFTLALMALCFAFQAQATVILDDVFADGTRSNQSLPTDAAWFFSNAGLTATTTNGITLSLPTGSFMGLSYYGANTSLPLSLTPGDTVNVTLKITLNSVAAQNTSSGIRFGIFDFADSTDSPRWVTADGFSTSSQGTNVQGYALFQNMGVTFSSASPMDLRKRTTATDKDLLGTTGDWTSLTTGPGSTNTFQGFANATSYSLQFSVQRSVSNTLNITVTWLNLSNNASLVTTTSDSTPGTFNFDGIGIRPSGSASTAGSLQINELKVEFFSAGSPAVINSEPLSQSVYTNQSATFSISAGGTAPLSYQWYYNTNTLIPNATNSSITITNAQLSDAGYYSVIVSNAYGSDNSVPTALFVTIPAAPSILAQPADLTVLPGDTASFTVQASGANPLYYQWYLNSTNPVANGSSSTLTITNSQIARAGAYSVVISNFVGSITSSNAVLTINTNPTPPVFITQPISISVLAGGNAAFNATVSGTAPISFQWYKNGSAVLGATSNSLILNNVQTTDSAGYALLASNSAGSTTSSNAVLTVSPVVPVSPSAYNLVGFGQGTTGGGVLPDTNANYAKVYTATDLANALNSKTVKIIEIMTNLSLGYNEIEAGAKAGTEPFRADNAPLLHPVLLNTGVSVIDVQKKNGLTIFSASGFSIKHAHLNIKNCGNVIVRNLRFDELWEWDEATKGQYDKQNWDFITIGDAGTVSNLWVDHCTFTKAYDGVGDIKQGSYNITYSWCKYAGDDGYTNRNSWVYQQLDSLESNKTAYSMYNFLRVNGFSEDDIFAIVQGHDKTHLIGANDLDPLNAQHTVTLHHEWFINSGDRLPRLRAGNVHDFNLYVDDVQALAANRLRTARQNAMSPANQSTLNNTYDFNNFLNGSISTEGGAVLVEKSVYIDCLYPLRNNQTDPSNPVYTGKIKSLDTIYQFDNTTVRGNSTDAGNPMGPFQAPIIAFSWNLSSNQLPYSYTPDDPSQLQGIVTSPTAGAGAGVLTWAKTNWLITSYPATAPSIITPPQAANALIGRSANFGVVVSGSTPLVYQWKKGAASLSDGGGISGSTTANLALANLSAGSAGTYSVVISNSAGSVTSTPVPLTIYSAPLLATGIDGSGHFKFNAAGGLVGANYIVQTTTNLSTSAGWVSVSTNQIPGNGAISFTETNTTFIPNHFYRVVFP